MTFSSQIKTQLCEGHQKLDKCCRHAFYYGLFLFSKVFSHASLEITTEHEPTAALYAAAVKQISGAVLAPVKAGKFFRIYINQPKIVQAVTANFDGTETINAGHFQGDCCIAAFTAGVFLACGTAVTPEKSYQLSFSCDQARSKMLEQFVNLLAISGFELKTAVRKGLCVAYLKDSDVIEDLLTFMGASKMSLTLIDVKILKDLRNRVNRMTNFEAANLDKTASAAAAQIANIKFIYSLKGKDYLPIRLQKAAAIRIKHPELSLTELSEKAKTQSRASLYRCFVRIQKIAKELQQEHD